MTAVWTQDIHYMPGRVRITVPGLKRNHALAQKMEEGLSTQKGIRNYEVNPKTGRALLYFDPGKYTLEAVILMLRNIAAGKTPIDESIPSYPAAYPHAHRHLHNTEFRDLGLEGLWAHVVLGGAALFLLSLKKFLRGSSPWTGSRAIYNFAAATTLVTGYPLLKKGLNALADRGFISPELLFGTLGYTSLLLRENVVGLSTVWAANVFTLINNTSLANSRREVNEMLIGEDLPVNVLINGRKKPVLASELEIGDEIVLKRGDRVPAKCRVVRGTAVVDETLASGRHQKLQAAEDSTLEEGSIIIEGTLQAQVADSLRWTPAVRYGRFMHKEDPHIGKLVGLAAGASALTYLATKNLDRAMAVLIAAAPTSLALVTPMAMTSAIRDLVQRNIRINNPEAVLICKDIDTVLFDKTGTLTERKRAVKRVISWEGYSRDEVIALAAAARKGLTLVTSDDPIVKEAVSKRLKLPAVTDVEFAGSGIKASYGTRPLLVGDAEFLYRRRVKVKQMRKEEEQLIKEGLEVIYLAVDGKAAGIIGVGEYARADAGITVKALKDLGIENIAVVSGDIPHRTEKLVRELGITRSWSGVTPLEKAQIVERLQQKGHKVCVVGDGVNDAEAMSRADVAVGMYYGGHTAILRESHFVIGEDGLPYLPEIFSIGRKLECTQRHNRFLSSGITIAGLLATAIGTIPLLGSPLVPHLSSLAIVIYCGLLSLKRSLNSTVSGESTCRQVAAAKELPVSRPAKQNNLSQRRMGIVAPFHSMTKDRAARVLKVFPEQGLDQAEADWRLSVYGPNKITQQKSPGFFKVLAGQMRDFMVLFSLGAGVVSLVLGEKVEAVTIGAIVLLETVMGSIQELRSEQSLQALKKLSVREAAVLRQGRPQKVSAETIVPGDVLVLEAGDKVPADARLVESMNLEVEEAALTGESLPVRKSAANICPKNTPLADRTNMVFTGTGVTKGKAKAVAVSTGMFSELGRIAEMLDQVERDADELQLEMKNMGKTVTKVSAITCVSIMVMGMLRGNPVRDMLRTGVSLAVGAVPEGLGALVTLAMAFAVQRMVKKNAIVRKLSAVPTLGRVDAVCTDKTGTLTENQMTVTDVFAGNKEWKVAGSGYKPEGAFYKSGVRAAQVADKDLLKLLHTGVACNNSRLEEKPGNIWEISGDPTEGALIALAVKAEIDHEELNRNTLRCREIPFDSQRKLMSVVCIEKDGEKVLYTKGAPETLIEKCSRILIEGEVFPLTAARYAKIQAKNKEMAGNALRVLAFAFKPLAEYNQDDEDENDLVFIGLAGMMDPPRAGVKEAVATCRRAGIKVVMITGDNKHTAAAIARKIGLGPGEVVAGTRLNEMSQQELMGRLDEIVVFARTSPEQKLRIVKALKKKGCTVAMTGDGVNDAPAMKEANIGFAMGRGGTEVTKEAAAIVLTDDNFTGIVNAIHEGRGIRNNIQTGILYVLSGNLGEVLAVFLATIAGMAPPLIPTQILWVNLVTEGFPALALGAAPPGRSCIVSTASNQGKQLFSESVTRKILRHGTVTGLTTFGTYLLALRSGAGLIKARTMAFANLIAGQMIYALDCDKVNSRSQEAKSWLKPAVALSTALLAAVVYIPALSVIFGTVPLNLTDWAKIFFSAGIMGRLG